MKKFFLLIAVAGMFSVMTGCKKDYVCTCTVHDSSGTIPDVSASATYENVSKKDAEDACDNGNSTSGTFTTTCTIK